ncbi:glycoside hydrolase family 36 N-terminal domain-containing protein, partial [Streptomyces phytophilus]|uniref:glycoside hydrolase family 36 N-terminal domain-containing protein n=1 Tax=Streptomyces phytophilus TaxID=722715 RepID=UPI0028682965
MVEVGGNGRIWLLSGEHSSYALRLNRHDELLHLHWGPRLTLADAEALAAEPPPRFRSFESRLDGREEYPVEGGPRFVRPALAVRAADGDGGRGSEWEFRGAETDDEVLRLTFHDPVHRLGVTLHYRMRAGADVLERWATAVHEGG